MNGPWRTHLNSSLNPRRTIGAIIAAPLKQNGLGDNMDARVRGIASAARTRSDTPL
jgi:ABC-type antimicrobial peptide transport system ATPase subunit